MLISTPTDATGSYSQFGYSVALSGDGNTVLVGTPYGNVNDFRSGYAAIFSAGTASIIREIDQTSYSLFGVSASISYDGLYCAIGAAGPGNMPFTIDGSVLVTKPERHVTVFYSLPGDYTIAGWSRWTAGTTMFSTPAVQLGTDGTRFTGAHNGTSFGTPDTITWPEITFLEFLTVANSAIKKTTGSQDWNGFARTSQSYTQTAYMTAKPGNTMARMAFGLSTKSGGTPPFDLDYGWLFNGDVTTSILENGITYPGFGGYTSSTIFSITYDSTNVSYYKNGQLQRVSRRAPSRPLYGQVNMYTVGSVLTELDFGYNFSRITNGVWQHVVFTYLGDYNISNIYVNGQLQAYIGAAPPNTTLAGPLTIGIDWKGYIDDVRTYAGVMSPEQVSAMYVYESTLPPEPSPISYTLPAMALNFGTSDVQSISNIGSYAVAVTGTVVSHDSLRLSKSVATPYFSPSVKYLSVTSKTISPSLANPGTVLLSSNYTLADEQTFIVQQTNRAAVNLQWTFTGVPPGLVVSSQTDYGVTFKIYKGTTIANSTFISVSALNPSNLSTSVVSFAVSVTDGIAVGGDFVADVNGRRIHVFTSASSTLTLLANGTVDMLLVGGGGGGGAGYAGGGGGGGGVLYRTDYSLGAGSYTITVGAGGRGGYGAAEPLSGGDTTIEALLTVLGGGSGATDQTVLGGAIVPARTGGSGGGGGANAISGALGTPGQGYEGGRGVTPGLISSGGGGGAGSPGGSRVVILTSIAGAYAQFGFASAISQDGRFLLVGAPQASNGDGYAALFDAVTGVFVCAFVSTAGTSAQFGSSIGISDNGSRVIIGAPTCNSGAGYAAVFDGMNGALVASLNGSGGNQFGFSVAISGDGTTAIAGTPGIDGLNGYVNAYTGTTYTTVTQMVYTPTNDEYFGHAVSVTSDGSIVLVGSPNKGSGSGYAAAFSTSTGSFYKEFMNTAGPFAYFGFSVAISSDGQRVVIGAPTANANAGYAAVYNVQSQNLVSTMVNIPGETSQFGFSVGIHNTGSFAIVGAPLAYSNGQGGYVGLFDASNGTVYRTFTPEYPMTGASVSISAGLVSAVGGACIEALPFRIDGGVTIYF